MFCGGDATYITSNGAAPVGLQLSTTFVLPSSVYLHRHPYAKLPPFPVGVIGVRVR